MIETSRLWSHTLQLRRFGLNRYGIWRDARRNMLGFFCNTRRNMAAVRADSLDAPGFDVEPLQQCVLGILDWAGADSVWVLQHTDDSIFPWGDRASPEDPSTARDALLGIDMRLRAASVKLRSRRPLRLQRPWDEDVRALFAYMLGNHMLEPFLVPSSGRCVVNLHHEKHLLILPRDQEAASALRGIALDHRMQLSAWEPPRPLPADLTPPGD